MPDYITESGTIHWDRAEPFIWLLAEHENEVFKNRIDYKNVKLLKAFLNKYGKIRPRRKTRISVQKQHAIAHAIKKSRAFKLIPFTCDVKL